MQRYKDEEETGKGINRYILEKFYRTREKGAVGRGLPDTSSDTRELPISILFLFYLLLLLFLFYHVFVLRLRRDPLLSFQDIT